MYTPFVARIISLAHLTLLRLSTVELVSTAAEAGFQGVGLRLMGPPTPNEVTRHAVGDAELMRETRRRLDDTGVQVVDVEAIWIDAEVDVPSHERMFESAAAMNA